MCKGCRGCSRQLIWADLLSVGPSRIESFLERGRVPLGGLRRQSRSGSRPAPQRDVSALPSFRARLSSAALGALLPALSEAATPFTARPAYNPPMLREDAQQAGGAVSTGDDSFWRCAACGAEVARDGDRIPLDGVATRAFMNPDGFEYVI